MRKKVSYQFLTDLSVSICPTKVFISLIIFQYPTVSAVGRPQPHFGKGGARGDVKIKKSLPKDTPLSLQQGVFIFTVFVSGGGF